METWAWLSASASPILESWSLHLWGGWHEIPQLCCSLGFLQNSSGWVHRPHQVCNTHIYVKCVSTSQLPSYQQQLTVINFKLWSGVAVLVIVDCNKDTASLSSSVPPEHFVEIRPNFSTGNTLVKPGFCIQDNIGFYFYLGYQSSWEFLPVLHSQTRRSGTDTTYLGTYIITK